VYSYLIVEIPSLSRRISIIENGVVTV